MIGMTPWQGMVVATLCVLSTPSLSPLSVLPHHGAIIRALDPVMTSLRRIITRAPWVVLRRAYTLGVVPRYLPKHDRNN